MGTPERWAGTLGGALERAAEAETERDGLIFIDLKESETKLAWRAVYERAQRAAGALEEAGVAAGERVAIILPTGPAFMDAFFGCQLLGAVPVPLYPPVRLGRLDEYVARTSAMLAAVDAALVVTEARIRRLLGQVMARFKPRLGLVDAAALELGQARAPTLTDPDDLSFVQFSSGTTVEPKAVALSHRAVLANARSVMDRIPHAIEDQPSGVSWLPLYHDMGLIGCVLPALLHPGPLALIPPENFLLKPALWLRAIARHRGTVSPAPNFAYGLCVDRVQDADLEDVDGRGTRCDLSSWLLALNGAEPVSPATLRAFRARFAAWGLREEALTPVYGLSEASLAVTFSDPFTPFRGQHFDRVALANGRVVPVEPSPAGAEAIGEAAPPPLELVSVGTPLEGFEVQIRDAQRRLAPEDRVGHLWVRGPSLMDGYLNRADSPIVDGWLDTGDLAFLHGGELYISGRAKDLLILRGRNHAPQEVEHAIDGLEGVRSGCSAAVAELSEEGERLLLFVEARQAVPGLADEVAQVAFSATGLRPDLVVVLEPGTLPRTSSGKIRRGEALRLWRNGDLLPPDKVTPWMLAGALAKSALGFWSSR